MPASIRKEKRRLETGEKQRIEQKLLPQSLERDHGIGKPGELIFEEGNAGLEHPDHRLLSDIK